LMGRGKTPKIDLAMDPQRKGGEKKWAGIPNLEKKKDKGEQNRKDDSEGRERRIRRVGSFPK